MYYRVLALTALLSLSVSVAAAQTWPTPFDLNTGDYTLTAWPASSAAGTYPAHLRFHRGPKQDPGLADQPNADYTAAYNATSGPRINGLGEDGFSFVNTGSGGDLGAAVLALNTTGLENVQVSWTGGTVAAQPRPYRIRLQYRVGDSGTFTDVPGPVEYVAGTAGHSQNFVTTLPEAVNDEPLVYVRWKYYQDGAGSGARPQLRVDDISVTTSDAPGSGTGTALFTPDLLRGGQARTLSLTVTAQSDDEEHRLTHVDFTLPESFGTVSPEDVVLTPAGGTVAVEGRTIRISGADITQSQPLRIDVQNVQVPDVSGAFEVGLRTGAGSEQTVAIAAQPQLRVWSTPEPIAQVTANDASGASTRLGDWVTVQGIVTVADQFQTSGGEFGPSYLQDQSGGIAVFSPEGVTANVEVGDEVILFGKVDQFFGLNQLDNSTIVIENVASGQPVQPTVVTLAQLAADGSAGNEQYEGRLVRINNVTVNTTIWASEGAGTNYQLSDGTGTLDVRVNRGVDFAGTAAPSGAFDIIGVVSQFRPAAPFVGGYQLLPRSAADIVVAGQAPAVTSSVPFEQAATPTSVTLHWTTDRPAHSEVRYVNYTTGEKSAVSDETPKTQHTLVLSDLDPATVYTLEFRSAVGGDTTKIGGYPVTTTAAPGTTHAIEVLFNKSVDTSLATETEATSGNFLTPLLARINGAQHSIDVALYSLSGQAGASIASALIAAKNRGVAVRVIMESTTSSTAPPTSLRNAGVPFIADDFGNNSGSGLHHNKFVVIDYRGGAPDEIWAMTGSWNPTDPGTNEHQQNVVWVQDGALAAAFTREFDQMWGSKTTTPGPAQSRFGANKTLVAPTVFWIGDTYTRLFFSPQGYGNYSSTEQQIIGALNTADHEIYLGLNLITRQPLVDAIKARFDDGVTVRGVIGEPNTTGSVHQSLVQFADVHEFPSGTLGLLHHKYAVVDALHPNSDPVVITGSHNWSRSANESNDENTLLFYDADMANQYVQEFAVRYREAGGSAAFPVAIEPVDGRTPTQFTLSASYPNPFTTTTTFRYTLPEAGQVTVRVYNVLGQEVTRMVETGQAPGTYSVTLDGAAFSSGVYFYVVEAATAGRLYRETGRMVRAQ